MNNKEDFQVDSDGVLQEYLGEDTEVKIPNGIKKIGEYAFSHHTSLKSIIIPNSVKEIGKSAFLKCEKLQSIVIPNSVKTIGDQVFEGCHSLKSISIPDSVTELGKGVFYDCESLQSVEIGQNIKYIDTCTFAYCTNLEEVKFLSKDVEFFIHKKGQMASPAVFLKCNKLECIYLPKEWKKKLPPLDKKVEVIPF